MTGGQPLAHARVALKVGFMDKARNTLLLAGSAEARQIASTAHNDQILALLSEKPRGPKPMPVPFRFFDFSDIDGLVGLMQDYDAVVDASHGFDAMMSAAGFAAAQQAGKPFVSVRRPAWDVAEHPRWRTARDVARAMGVIDKDAVVFSATGWASLGDYGGFPGRRLLLRQTTRHDRMPPYDFVELVFGDPPFTLVQEVALFQQLNIDTLICRNLGGQPSRPKLDAAKQLDLTVILIDRPPLPDGAAQVASASEAAEWLAAL